MDKAILIRRREQLRSWVATLISEYEEAHLYLDELGIPWYEGRRILTMKERLEILIKGAIGK